MVVGAEGRAGFLCLSKHVSICKSDIIACTCVCWCVLVCISLFFGLFILFAHFAMDKEEKLYMHFSYT